MRWMTGLELCGALRARAATRGIPILLHTTSELPDEASRLCDGVIAKPADLDALIAMIRSLTARPIAT
jgi:CheY-like chemotaxis protein